jgi:hypothetical protein
MGACLWNAGLCSGNDRTKQLSSLAAQRADLGLVHTLKQDVLFFLDIIWRVTEKKMHASGGKSDSEGMCVHGVKT